MRVAITGVSSTGKTQLSKDIAARLNVPWISEGCNGAFKFLKDNGIELTTTDFSKMTAHDHVEFEKAVAMSRFETESKHESYVADGEPLLWSSYLLLKGCQYLPENEMESILMMMERMIDRYDYIWYLPFGRFPIVKDGYRIDNRYFLLVQDAILRQSIKSYTEPINHKAKVIEVDSVFHEYRIGEILRVIENHDK